MGREVKRVPLDFDLPIRQHWSGYVMPQELCSETCAACSGTGYNPATRVLADAYYDSEGNPHRWAYDYGTAPDGSKADRPPWRIKGDCRRWCNDLTQDEVDMLAASSRLMDLTHTFKAGEGWKPRDPMPRPTPVEVARWNEHTSFGLDGSARYLLVKHRAQRLGIFGECDACKGEGEIWRDEAQKAAHEAWERTDPPKGDGWQMWENTSEGSPISPVFATPRDLALWLAKTKASAFGDSTATYDEWMSMIDDGYAPSMVGIAGVGIMSGVEAASRR